MNNAKKIGYFSDSHAKHKRLSVPEGLDMLIFGGDCMTDGYSERELVDFLIWYDAIDVPNKVMIAGNHDRYIENHPRLFRDLLQYYPTISYLENSGVRIENINIYGIPDSHFFFDWAFKRSSEQLTECANSIPDDVNILVTHAPAYGILDMLETGERVGEPEFTKRIKELKQLKYHLFGHVHEAFGINELNYYTAINGSVVDERYYLVNPITIFEYGE